MRYFFDRQMVFGGAMDSIVFTVALVLGALCILAVLFSYTVRGRFELRDVSFLLFGVLLSGMSVWPLISFKIGVDGSIEGRFEQSIGESKAETNAELERVKKEIDTLSKSVSALAQTSPDASGEISKIQDAGKPSDQFIKNSNYTVLIFYKDSQATNASQLLDQLLRMGFKSSTIKTDLSEAKQQYSSGTAWIVWESGRDDVVANLQAVIKKALPQTNVVVRPEAYDLNRGDVQILMF
jgi:hypothetical protein